MPLWVNIENVASGLFVTMSKAQNGAQLCLEVDDTDVDDNVDDDVDDDDDEDDTDDDDDVTQREVSGKEEQLWDYMEMSSSGIFRNKTGFVADMKGSVGPEVTMTILSSTMHF